uniref:Vacuolar protein sorting/targeting protein 10 n=1 Tax=Lygus hesperus TaxID=30085 RepID=A0A0A9YIP9_LYGHE
MVLLMPRHCIYSSINKCLVKPPPSWLVPSFYCLLNLDDRRSPLGPLLGAPGKRHTGPFTPSVGDEESSDWLVEIGADGCSGSGSSGCRAHLSLQVVWLQSLQHNTGAHQWNSLHHGVHSSLELGRRDQNERVCI